MKVKYFYLALLLCVYSHINGQTLPDSQQQNIPGAKQFPDQQPIAPSAKAVIRDSISPINGNITPTQANTAVNGDSNNKRPGYAQIIKLNPYYNFSGKATALSIQKRTARGKEDVFYLLCGVLLFFACIKLFFNKYLQNLLSVFFRISLKQKQMREQLLQSPLPSLLLNGFFVITSSIYVVFLLRIHQFNVAENFWWLLLYCMLAIVLVYLVKFLGLKFVGWVFNMREASSTYIFIVFLINKLLGIFLMPFLILIAFSESSLLTIWITLSYVVVFIAFGYRYASALGPVRREINVNPLHFFIYLCAFEIIPVILIYKVLMKFLERSF